MKPVVGIVFAAAILAFPAAALAQSVVRSGEHESFTRIVARIPDGATWQASQSGREVTLAFEGTAVGFDTSRIFDLIPRDRLSGVLSDDTRLVLTLACDCPVAGFEVPGGFVALDILSPGSSTRLPLVAQRPAAQQARVDLPRSGARTNLPLIDIPFRAPAFDIPQTPDPAAANGAEPPAPTSGADLSARPLPEIVANRISAQSDNRPEARALAVARAPLDPAAQALLTELQGRLQREFGTAATQGLLDPRGPSALPQPARPQIDTQVFADQIAPPEEPAPDQPAQPLSNIRISTSMDLPNGPQLLQQEQVSLTGVVCPAEGTLDVMHWSDGRTFDQQVGPLRQALYGEFDKLDQKTAVKLAKTYLYFGFGAEARQVLTLDPDLVRKEDLLLAIAEIMENGAASPAATLRSLVDCPSETSLWAIMANDVLPEDAPLDPVPALRTLNTLPVHLRRFIAPGLSDRLLAHGLPDEAATALRSLKRLPEELPPEATLALARVSLHSGEVDAGQEQLGEVIGAGASPSPEALVVLIDEKIRMDQPIDAMTAGLAEAYAKELQDSPLGPDLRRAHVLALLKSGQFDRAFESADQLVADSDDATPPRLRQYLLRELVQQADDVVFLDRVFKEQDADIIALPRSDRIAVIERLLNLGFSQSASRLAASLPDRPAHEPSQLLKARIALSASAPEDALLQLEGLDTPDAKALRAEAKRQTGALEQAQSLYQSMDEPWNAAQAGWLADNWQELTDPDAPVFGPLVALSENARTEVQPGDGMLTRSGAVLEESQVAREQILQLLQAPELAIASDEAGGS